MLKHSFKNCIVVFLCFVLTSITWFHPMFTNLADEKEATLFWNYMGGSRKDLFVQSISENGLHYVIGNTNSPQILGAINKINHDENSLKYHGFLSVYQHDFDKLLFTVFIGGSNIDIVSQMVISKEYVYIIGTTSSPDLPNTTNSKEEEQSGFITRINKTNGTIDYTTYLGDKDFDRAVYIFDTEENLFVFGQNDNYNVIIGVRPEKKEEIKRVYSFFVASIDRESGSIKYLKRFAETEEEQNTLQVVEKADAFLIAMYTDSKNFPSARFKESLGQQNIVIAEITKKEGNIRRATYFGGSDEDHLYQLIDDQDKFYIIGRSKSKDLKGLINANKSSTDDGFISCFDFKNFTVLWTMYMGGSSRTYLRDALISGDYILLTGLTQTNDFPGIKDTEYKEWKECNFISKINKYTGEFVYSTLLDFTGKSYLNNIYLQNGLIYILGITKANFILKAKNKNHNYPNNNETFDGFISRFDFETGNLIDSFLFGGKFHEYPGTLFFEEDKIFIVGDSLSDRVSYTNQESFGDYDIFVTAIRNDYYDYSDFVTEIITKPESLEYSKYWLAWRMSKVLFVKNNGAVSLDVTVKSDFEWITIVNDHFTLSPTETKRLYVKIINEKVKVDNYTGSIYLASQAGTKIVPVKILIGESKPKGKKIP